MRGTVTSLARLLTDDVTATLTLLRYPALFRAACATPLLGYLRRRTMRRWQSAGRPVPPPAAVKQQLLMEYGRRFGLSVLVESGTYVGLTVAACLRSFDRIYSIELDRELFLTAQRQFQPFEKVTILGGDSGSVLRTILSELSGPALFWLDAHYSGGITARGETDTPIQSELAAILGHHVRDHVVLIDDAREFDGRNGYPRVEALRAMVADLRPGWSFALEDDVIRMHAQPPPAVPAAGTRGPTNRP
jgi:hypothetical protein